MGLPFGGTEYWQTNWRLSSSAFINSSFPSRHPPHSGRFQLKLRARGSEARRSVDLSRQTAVRLQFWAKAGPFEPGERAEALVCSRDCEDEANWILIKSWADGESDSVYLFFDFALAPNMLTKEFWVRFRTGVSDTERWLFIDDISFVSPMPGPTPTLLPVPTPFPSGPETGPTPTPVPITINVDAGDFFFEPDKIFVESGQEVTFTVTNVGAELHTFVIVPSDSAQDKLQPFINVGFLPGGGVTDTMIIPPEVSSLYFYCAIVGHESSGMFGTIEVGP